MVLVHLISLIAKQAPDYHVAGNPVIQYNVNSIKMPVVLFGTVFAYTDKF